MSQLLYILAHFVLDFVRLLNYCLILLSGTLARLFDALILNPVVVHLGFLNFFLEEVELVAREVGSVDEGLGGVVPFFASGASVEFSRFDGGADGGD